LRRPRRLLDAILCVDPNTRRGGVEYEFRLYGLRIGIEHRDEGRGVGVVGGGEKVVAWIVHHLVNPELTAGRDRRDEGLRGEVDDLDAAVTVSGPEFLVPHDLDAVGAGQVVVYLPADGDDALEAEMRRRITRRTDGADTAEKTGGFGVNQVH